MSGSTIGSCLRRAFWLEPSCVYLEIRTIDDLLAYPGCQQNHPATYRLPRLFNLSSKFPALQATCLSWRPRRGQAGCGRTWPAASSLGFYAIKVKLDAFLGGDVLIVMHSRSHMTLDTRIPTDRDGAVRAFTYQANIASNKRDAP